MGIDLCIATAKWIVTSVAGCWSRKHMHMHTHMHVCKHIHAHTKTLLCLPLHFFFATCSIKDIWHDLEKKDVNSQCQVWTGIWQLAMSPVLSLPLPAVWSPLVPTNHINPSQWSSTWSSFPLWSAPEELLLSQVYTAHGLVIAVVFCLSCSSTGNLHVSFRMSALLHVPQSES